MKQDRRIARFYVATSFDEDVLSKIFAYLGIVPTQVSHDYAQRRLDYIAYSKHFEPVPYSNEIPIVDLVVHTDEQGEFEGCDVRYETPADQQPTMPVLRTCRSE